jgi:hypothetical protein
MAQKFVTNIDLNQNQLIKGTFEVLASDPGTNLFDGRLIFNSTEGTIKVYDVTASAWRKMISGVSSTGSQSNALTINESNGSISITPNLSTSASAGLMSASDFSKLADAASEATASKLVIRDASSQAKFGTPTDDSHVATKGYVDAARSGLDVKQSVRVATTAAVLLASGLENGDTIDGVTLATGNRVLVKDQSTASENGIYVVQASGAAVRATDFDSNAEVTPGAFTFVEEGTANADSGWVLSTNGTITVGTTGLTFAQFSGAGQVVAGDGLTKTGNTLNVVGTAGRITANADSIDIASTYVGQSTITTLGTITTGTWDATTVAVTAGGTGVETFTDNGIVYGNGASALDVTAAGTQYQVLQAGSGGVPAFGALNLAQSAAVTGALPILNGGTNATTESSARTNLASASAESSGRTTSTPSLARTAKQACAASSVGVSTTVVTHNFNTIDVMVQIYEVSSGNTVIGDTVRTNSNTVTVTMYGTITAGEYVIIVQG